MNALLISLALAAIGLYVVASVLLARHWVMGQDCYRGMINPLVFIAWALHVMVIASVMHASQPTWSIGLTQVFSAILACVIMLCAQIARTRAGFTLFIFILPLAALSLVLLLTVPSTSFATIAENGKSLIHIVLSILAFSCLFVAALQAILLAIGEYALRHKHISQQLSQLPPLQTMEQALFRMIGIGFVLLTLVLVSSLLFYPAWLEGVFLEKMLLTVFAWVVFALLLAGRYYYGWRGAKAIKGTWLGMLLLILSYFGTRLVMH